MYRLREIERRDISTINLWRNNPELIELLGAPFRYINSDVDQNWFDSYMSNRGTTVRCAIVDENDAILGLVSLTGIDYLNQCAEFHIMIGDSNNQGKGLGTFALTEILKHAFYNMNLRRIELSVLEDNKRAQRLYEKCGFVCEGVRREAIFKNGKFVNQKFYSILRNEFKNK